MEHSNSYLEFKKQLYSQNKKDGYNNNLLSSIYESERRSVERKIWSHFIINKDIELAMFLPQLKYYDGYKLLIKKLSRSNIPSVENFKCAFTLYKATEKKEYLDIIIENYKKLPQDNYDKPYYYLRREIVVQLHFIGKNELVYPFLKDIYINDKDEANRIQAVIGILFHDGFIDNLYNTNDISKHMNLVNPFRLETATLRKNYLIEYESKRKER